MRPVPAATFGGVWKFFDDAIDKTTAASLALPLLQGPEPCGGSAAWLAADPHLHLLVLSAGHPFVLQPQRRYPRLEPPACGPESIQLYHDYTEYIAIMSWRSGLWSFARDERVILVSIGLATFSVVSTMIAALTMIRDDNEIPPAEPKTQYITQDTEDALELDTLSKLLEHPNYSIRDIATKILCDRAINDPDTTTHLLYGITRTDYDERMKSLTALSLLTGRSMGEY